MLEGSGSIIWHRIGLIVFSLGGAAMAFGLYLLNASGEESSHFWLAGGSFVAMIGLFTLAIMVRCPQCRIRLFWYALTQVPHAAGIAWYMGLERCPECGYAADRRGDYV